jgi:hypothetical protein
MAYRIAKLRLKAAEAQQYRCYYCESPIWEADQNAFAQRHGLRPKQAALLRSTAEHLLACRDGGRDTRCNIVAACLHCNRSRHAVPTPKAPVAYRDHVRSRMRKGRWLVGLLSLGSPLAQLNAVASLSNRSGA